jgi:hypothetical protein
MSKEKKYFIKWLGMRSQIPFTMSIIEEFIRLGFNVSVEKA